MASLVNNHNLNKSNEHLKIESVRLYLMTHNDFQDEKFSPYQGTGKLRLQIEERPRSMLLKFIDTNRDTKYLTKTSNSPLNETDNNHSNHVNNPNTSDTVMTTNDNQLENENNNHLHSENNHKNQPSLQGLHLGQRVVFEMTITKETQCFPFSNDYLVMNCESNKKAIVMIQFNNIDSLNYLRKSIEKLKRPPNVSVFDQRTDISSATQYFQFYGYLSQQQNMMQDYVRTATYQKAILLNSDNFKDKVVLDVGAGSGILSFFAVQAGARKVYAVEASTMAKCAQLLVESNNLNGSIEVIAGKIEDIELPQPVDIIISEPMGYMLINERMLETYLHAKKWLRTTDTSNGPTMFPSRGDLHIAPFTDAQLYLELSGKANFWYAKDFHGVDLRALHSTATDEYFKQPVVDTFDCRILMANSIQHIIDFQTSKESDLHCMTIPLEFVVNQTAHLHGLAFWFDVAFLGTTQSIWLSTSPSQPLTHWYQVRCLLTTPLFVTKGQHVNGTCILRANSRQSYDVDIEVFVKESGTRSSNFLDLKNPYFRYTGQPVQVPPGASEVSPSELMWQMAPAMDTYQQQTNQMIHQQQQHQQPLQQQHSINQQLQQPLTGLVNQNQTLTQHIT